MSRTLPSLLLLAAVVAGCPKPAPQVDAAGAHIAEALPTPAPDAQRTEAVQQLVRNFERVHFETDSDRLTQDAQAALDANAEILVQYNDVQVEVQGHADERGTVDYNLALGQRRARAVVQHLSRMGVAPSRLPTVSFGEERPLDESGSEVAWSRNRRAEFRVLDPSAPVDGTTD